jgi:type IV pilus assembly protein PilA
MLTRIRRSMDERDQGFTLIELLVVIIIIGILAAIAIPVFLNQRKKGWDAAVQADLRNAATSMETYLTANGVYSTQTPAGTELTGVGFKYSNASNYDATAGQVIVVGAAAGNSYCLSSLSASGNHFSYGSTSGLRNDGGTAKATNTAGVCS